MSDGTYDNVVKGVIASMSSDYRDYRERKDIVIDGISERIDKYRKQDVYEIRKALDATTPKNLADRAVYHTQQEYFRMAPQTFEGDNYASAGYRDVYNKSRPLTIALSIGYREAALSASVEEAVDYFSANSGQKAEEFSQYVLNDKSSDQLLATYGGSPANKSLNFQRYDSPEKIAEIEAKLDDKLNLTTERKVKVEVNGELVEQKVSVTYSIDECREMLAQKGAYGKDANPSLYMKDGLDPELCQTYVKNYELIENRKLFREDMEKLKTGGFIDNADRSRVISRLSNLNDAAIVNEASTVRFSARNGAINMNIDSFDYGEHVFSQLKKHGLPTQKKMMEQLDGLDVSAGQTHVLDTLSDDMGSVLATDSLLDTKTLYAGAKTLQNRATNHKIAEVLKLDSEGKADLIGEAKTLREGFSEKDRELLNSGTLSAKAEEKIRENAQIQADAFHDMVSQHALRIDYLMANDAEYRAANASKVLASRAGMLSGTEHLGEMLSAIGITGEAVNTTMESFADFLNNRERILNNLNNAGIIKDHIGTTIELNTASSTSDVAAVLSSSSTGTIVLKNGKNDMSFEDIGKAYDRYLKIDKEIREGKLDVTKLEGDKLTDFNFGTKLKSAWNGDINKDMKFLKDGIMTGRENSFMGVAETLNAYAKITGEGTPMDLTSRVTFGDVTGIPRNIKENGIKDIASNIKTSDLTELSRRVEGFTEFVGQGFGDTGAAAYRELFQGHIASLAVVNDKNKIIYTSFARLDNMSAADKALNRNKRMSKGYAKGMALKPMRQDENMSESMATSGRVKDVGSLAYQRTLARRVNNSIADKFFALKGPDLQTAERTLAAAQRSLSTAKLQGDANLIAQAQIRVREAQGVMDLSKFETETQKLARMGKLKEATARKTLGMQRYGNLSTRFKGVAKKFTDILKKPGELARKLVLKVAGSAPVKLLGSALLFLIKVDLILMLICVPVIMFCGVVDYAADKVQSGITAFENWADSDILPAEAFEESDPFDISGFLSFFKDYNKDFTTDGTWFRDIDDGASTMFQYGSGADSNMRYYALGEMIKSLGDTEGMVQRGMVNHATRFDTTIYFTLHTGTFDDAGNEIVETIKATDLHITADKNDPAISRPDPTTGIQYDDETDGEVNVKIDGNMISTTENFRELVCMLTATMQYDFVNCPYEFGDHGEGDAYKGKWTAAKMKILLRLLYKTTHWYEKEFKAWLADGEKGNIQQNPYTIEKKERLDEATESVRLEKCDYSGTPYTMDVKVVKDRIKFETRIQAVYDEIINMYVLKGKSAWSDEIYGGICVPGESTYGLRQDMIKDTLIKNTDGYYENDEPWQLNPDGSPVTEIRKQALKNEDGSIATDGNGNPIYVDVEVPVTYKGWDGSVRDTKIFEGEVEFSSEYELSDEPDVETVSSLDLYVSMKSDPKDKNRSYSAYYDSKGRLTSRSEAYYDNNGNLLESFTQSISYDDELYKKLSELHLRYEQSYETNPGIYSKDYCYGCTYNSTSHWEEVTAEDGHTEYGTKEYTESWSIVSAPSGYAKADKLIVYTTYRKDPNLLSKTYSTEIWKTYTYYNAETGAPLGSVSTSNYTSRYYYDDECTKQHIVHSHNDYPYSYSGDGLYLLNQYGSCSCTYYDEDGHSQSDYGGYDGGTGCTVRCYY